MNGLFFVACSKSLFGHILKEIFYKIVRQATDKKEDEESEDAAEAEDADNRLQVHYSQSHLLHITLVCDSHGYVATALSTFYQFSFSRNCPRQVIHLNVGYFSPLPMDCQWKGSTRWGE